MISDWKKSRSNHLSKDLPLYLNKSIAFPASRSYTWKWRQYDFTKMKRAAVTGLHRGMILNIQAKPRLVDSKLILLIRKQAQVNWKCVQNPGGQASGGARIWISRPSEPKPSLAQGHPGREHSSDPMNPRHELWAAENEWEISTGPGNMDTRCRATHVS